MVDFIQEATAIIPDFWVESDLSNSFSDISSAMEMISVIANLVVTGSVVAIFIILNLLITLFLRDRKHEIGIYLALGEKNYV